jgi:hypothetical protein
MKNRKKSFSELQSDAARAKKDEERAKTQAARAEANKRAQDSSQAPARNERKGKQK